MQDNVTFPAIFSEAKRKLRAKFPLVNPDIIEDGIQYARIQYWQQDIERTIPDQSKAFGWFLRVARNYLCNELDKSKLNLSLTEARNVTYAGTEKQYIASDLLLFLKTRFGNSTSCVINHAMGYSLSELADRENLSINAMKQRHCRAKKTIMKLGRIFYD